MATAEVIDAQTNDCIESNIESFVSPSFPAPPTQAGSAAAKGGEQPNPSPCTEEAKTAATASVAHTQAFDLDNSGTIDAGELAEAAYAFRRAKEQAAMFKKVAIGFALALIVVLFMNMGLTAAAIQLSRDTYVSKGGVMQTSNGETVQAANSDMRIDASGALVMRSQETPESDARRLQTTGVHSEAGGLNMAIGVRQQYQRRELSSTMPDKYFKELVWFELESPSGSTVALRVSSIVRVPRQSAACGSVLVLATSLGRVTLDDTTLAFDHDLGLLFTEAGFAVQEADDSTDEVLAVVARSTGGRRGRSLQQASTVGFFNAVDDGEWTCSTAYAP